MSIAETWGAVADEPIGEDESRAFVAQKLGDLQAQLSKLIAILNLSAPVQANRFSGGNRRLLIILIVLVSLLYVLLGLHVAWTAGWLGH